MLHDLQVFLASPGDVADERGLAIKVLTRLQLDPMLRDRIRLEAMAWDHPNVKTPFLAGMPAQDSVTLKLGKPSDCDIVVVILWSKLGSPIEQPRYAKPDGKSYYSGTEWEFDDSLQAYRECGKPQILLYHRIDEPIVKLNSSNETDIRNRIDQIKHVEAFLKACHQRDGTTPNEYHNPSEFEEILEGHLKEQIRGILKPGETPEPFSRVIPSSFLKGPPFPGLRSFTDADKSIFFGRGRETDDLIRKLNDPANRVVIVVGASGSGKSSIVWAGLIPRLKDGAIEGSQNWEYVRFTPGEVPDSHNPFTACVLSFNRFLPRHGRTPRDVTNDLQQDADRFNELVQIALEDKPYWSEVVLFIDQFEELFTLVKHSYRESFIALLVLASKTPRVRIVATMRADFFGECMECSPLAEFLRTGAYPLAAPGHGALYEMITKPAKLAGLVFEKDLTQRIVNDTLGDTGKEPGALALMAFALSELYNARMPNGSLTHEAYESFGGVRGAVAKKAEKVYEQFGADEQEVMNDVFHQLVEVDERGDAHRQRAVRIQVCRSPAAETFVDDFTNARLLVSTDEKGEPIVEVAHEALLRNWPRLKNWIEMVIDELALLRQVRTEAARWDKQGRPEILLWPHERLLPVPHMIERLRYELTDIERTFVRPEIERLKEELENPTITHYRRAEIGDRMASISDSRPGVGLDSSGVPDIDWVLIRGGSIELEGDAGVLAVEPFHIARYPITWKQYQVFLKSPDGYINKQWWRNLRREKDHGRQYRPIGNCPVENVSWFDAVAFCRWLTAKLDLEVRLPCEFEWQLAATGGDKEKMYPWGTHWKSGKTNTRETGLQRTTSVGMYPQGVSPLGVVDMAGNVWEWCLNKYRYPKNIRTDGKITMDYSEDRCVVRGGSWRDDRYKAYSSYRSYGPVHPRNRFNYIGFRVVGLFPIR